MTTGITCEHCNKTQETVIKEVDGVQTIAHEPLITLSNGNKYCLQHYNEDGIYLAVKLKREQEGNK